jgi:hypothetical protein
MMPMPTRSAQRFTHSEGNFVHTRSLSPARPAVAVVAGLAAALLCACSTTSSQLVPPSNSAAAASQRVVPDGKTLTFTTIDDNADLTFNQLLGIDNKAEIAGYFGSGASGHPNKGYTILPPYGQANYTNENYPGSAQTQVTALNNLHDTAGFWVDANGNNFGFIEWNGVFSSYKDPKTGKGTVNQILGLNDAGTAVGFYTDATGVNHGFSLDQATGKFTAITPPGLSNVIASGINQNGDITGFGAEGTGNVVGWILKGRTFSTFSFPGSNNTTPLGINVKDEMVGTYVDSASAMHGFTVTDPLTKAKYTSIDDPNGIGTTTINGLNDKGALVGFYVDGNGFTDGFLATK